MEYSEHLKAQREKTEALIEDFSDLVNNFNFESKPFIQAFSRQHRTLQQNMFRTMVDLIIFMSSDEYRTDGRNEGSKALAKKLIAGYAEITKVEEKDRLLNREGCGETYSEEKAEEYRLQILTNPQSYIGLSHI